MKIKNRSNSKLSKKITALLVFMVGMVSIAGSNQTLMSKYPESYTEVEHSLDSLSNLLDHVKRNQEHINVKSK